MTETVNNSGCAYEIAIIGLVGALLGALITSLSSIVKDWLERGAESKKDTPRKKVLKEMLEDTRFPDKWRNLRTLMHVTGSDEETAKRLLLEIGARASEDGKELWGLIKYHPLDEKQ